MASERRFYRTIVTITVLSEDEPLSEDTSLEAIAFEINDGGMSGQTTFTSEQITALDAAQSLIAQGSASEFFRLTPEGELLD